MIYNITFFIYYNTSYIIIIYIFYYIFSFV
nr:MAG TPA: hypothetical protein [Caudoviricetes sp.]